MLKTKTEFLTPTDIEAIHNTSMRLLTEVGIQFPSDEALDIFISHGFKNEGQKVFFSEGQVMEAIKSVPSTFTINARNPDRDVSIGSGRPVFAPGLGSPFLVETTPAASGKRDATLADYQNAVRLAQILPNQDLNGYQMVMPVDIPSEQVYLEMLLAGMFFSDKAFIGCTDGHRGSSYTMDMAKILFGEHLSDPVTLGVVNPLSPLAYSVDMIEAIVVYAQHNQPLLISTLVMAGSTGPITMAGVLAQQSAEILAGIVLAQLVRPGTPVIFGSTSTNIDMRTGDLAIGGPELSLFTSAHAQMARFYGLPCRGGGALTDSCTSDAQSGFESMFSLLTAINCGIDFVLHSAGILNSYMAFSFEKFVLDDEMVGMLKKYLGGIEVTEETLGFDVIAKVGADGHFLGEDHTLERCRTEFWQPDIANRNSLEAWAANGNQDATARASQRVAELIESHQMPYLDTVTANQLKSYVEGKSRVMLPI